MYTSILTSTLLLASTALATNYGDGSSGGGSYGGGSYGGGSSYSGGSSSAAGWNSWEKSSAVVPAAAAATGPPSPPSAPPSGELLVQVVSVSDANASLKYYPDSIQAPVGSIVQFQFHPKNHTITESSFAAPCIPLAKNVTTATRPGQKSGFVPVTGSEPNTPVYNLLINDTKPIWIYCGQANHCQKGMAMVINQNLTEKVKTIENYIIAAKALAAAGSSSSSSSAAASTSTAVVAAPPPPPAYSSTSTVVVAAPPPPPGTQTATGGGLPPPTGVAASTTAAVAPATFTGAASPKNVEGMGVVAGLAVVGLAALL